MASILNSSRALQKDIRQLQLLLAPRSSIQRIEITAIGQKQTLSWDDYDRSLCSLQQYYNRCILVKSAFESCHSKSNPSVHWDHDQNCQPGAATLFRSLSLGIPYKSAQLRGNKKKKRKTMSYTKIEISKVDQRM